MIKPTANRYLAKKRVHFLNVVLCFASSSVLADSLALTTTGGLGQKLYEEWRILKKNSDQERKK